MPQTVGVYITTNRAKHQPSLFDKTPMVYRFLHACLTFQFRSCTVKEGNCGGGCGGGNRDAK